MNQEEDLTARASGAAVAGAGFDCFRFAVKSRRLNALVMLQASHLLRRLRSGLCLRGEKHSVGNLLRLFPRTLRRQPKRRGKRPDVQRNFDIRPKEEQALRALTTPLWLTKATARLRRSARTNLLVSNRLRTQIQLHSIFKNNTQFHFYVCPRG
jgi:hypothetical protein